MNHQWLTTPCGVAPLDSELAQGNLHTQAFQQRLTYPMFRYEIDNDSTTAQRLILHLGTQLGAIGAVDEICKSQITLALTEALTNAIDHGNLELKSELRESEDGDEQYDRLATERRNQDPYQHRSVSVSVTLSSESATFVIADQGPGFNPATIPDPTDPANIEKPWGRGLMLIRNLMDEVKHNAVGNEITLLKRLEEAHHHGFRLGRIS